MKKKLTIEITMDRDVFLDGRISKVVGAVAGDLRHPYGPFFGYGAGWVEWNEKRVGKWTIDDVQEPLTREDATQLAAQIWCRHEMEKRQVDTDAVRRIADILIASTGGEL